MTARAIGELLSDIERQAFIAHARSHVDARTIWRHQGRSARGLDCGGLIAVSLASAGRTVVDALAYGRRPYRKMLEATLEANFGAPVPKDFLAAGDIALMRFSESQQCSHVGIVADHPVGGLSLIHAFAQVRRVVEHRIDAEWMNNIAEVYRP